MREKPVVFLDASPKDVDRIDKLFADELRANGIEVTYEDSHLEFCDLHIFVKSPYHRLRSHDDLKGKWPKKFILVSLSRYSRAVLFQSKSWNLEDPTLFLKKIIPPIEAHEDN